MARVPVRELTPVPMLLMVLFSAALLAASCLVTSAAEGYDSDVFRNYFGCPTCDLSECKPAPPGCELVKEPGICGCCPICARQPGDSCGIYTPKCAAGMTCHPPANAINHFESLFLGQGTCGPSEGASKYLQQRKRASLASLLHGRFSRGTD